MSRYRKIDTRVWGDEQLRDADPPKRLAWFAFLTHPVMNPMGAGIFSAQLLDALLGRAGDWCFFCNEMVTGCAHRGETILGWFSERSMIRTDGDLVIVSNFLAYNCPDNPNTLANWIESCEELPRSKEFEWLRDHLRGVVPELPEWLFLGLLDPLADQKTRGLKALFWDRVGLVTPKPGQPRKRSAKRSPGPSTERSREPYVERSGERMPEPGAGAGAVAVAVAVAGSKEAKAVAVPLGSPKTRTEGKPPTVKLNGNSPHPVEQDRVVHPIKYLLTVFAEKFHGKFSAPHPPMGAAEAKLAQGIIKTYGLEKALIFVEGFFLLKSAWLLEAGYTFRIFHTQLGKLVMHGDNKFLAGLSGKTRANVEACIEAGRLLEAVEARK